MLAIQPLPFFVEAPLSLQRNLVHGYKIFDLKPTITLEHTMQKIARRPCLPPGGRLKYYYGGNSMTNTAKEVLARVEKMTEARESYLQTLQEKIDTERKAEAAAHDAIEKAVANLDFEANHEAQKALEAAAERRGLLQRRADQLRAGKLVTEEESDKTIDSLLQYEAELSAAFEEEISAPLFALRKIYTAYADAIQDAEGAIEAWTRIIHPNYRSRGTRYANGTDRADHPVSVHSSPYMGCEKSREILQILQQLRLL